MTPAPQPLAQLVAMMDAATPAPWIGENCGEKCDAIVIGTGFSIDDDECKQPLAGWPEMYDEDGAALVTVDERVCEIEDGCSNPMADARLIVALRNAAPALLAELAELRAGRDREAVLESALKSARFHLVSWRAVISSAARSKAENFDATLDAQRDEIDAALSPPRQSAETRSEPDLADRVMQSIRLSKPRSDGTERG